ncbi:MAG TPA: RNA methyltransferase [Candidatus Kapabacteria bacterium]|nr:RNA methyltransferase [Candidatus Kapabacteria bacterium]
MIRSLHRRKGREAERAYLAEGERLLDELAADSGALRFLFCHADRLEWLLSRFPGAECCVMESADSGLFGTENAQGVGAVVTMPEPVSARAIADAGGPLLYLDRIADPGNLGTIIRTAEWFGLRGLLLGAGCADPFNPKVVRSTMGAIFRLPIADRVPLETVLELGRPLVALDAGGGDTLGSAPLPRNALYVVGSEAHGVDAALAERGRRLAIAGGERGESLNAAVAAAILLYELRRGGTIEPPSARRTDRA